MIILVTFINPGHLVYTKVHSFLCAWLRGKEEVENQWIFLSLIRAKGTQATFFVSILRAISGECLSSVMKENREDGGGEARAVAVSCSLVSRSLVSLHHLSL